MSYWNSWHIFHVSEPTDFSQRDNPDQRILAIGHWALISGWNADGGISSGSRSRPHAPPPSSLLAPITTHSLDYWESIRDRYGANPRIEFRGYVCGS